MVKKTPSDGSIHDIWCFSVWGQTVCCLFFWELRMPKKICIFQAGLSQPFAYSVKDINTPTLKVWHDSPWRAIKAWASWVTWSSDVWQEKPKLRRCCPLVYHPLHLSRCPVMTETPHYWPQQDTWNWCELSVLSKAGACQATAAGLKVCPLLYKILNIIPKHLHKTLTMPSHVGENSPSIQPLLCSKPAKPGIEEGWTHLLTPHPHSTHTQQQSLVWWYVLKTLQLFAVWEQGKFTAQNTQRSLQTRTEQRSILYFTDQASICTNTLMHSLIGKNAKCEL